MNLSTAGPMVLDALTKACDQNPDILKPAEKQLQDWETQPGFYTILSEVFCNHNLDVNVRWLAVLYCKNGVDRYWRRTAPNAIHEEEKERLKAKLVSNFNEPVPQIATQLAVLAAKIARLDCPRNWEALLPSLFSTVRSDDKLMQERALLTLHHVTKTLASKRLAPDRKLFEDLTSEIFGYVLELWTSYLQVFNDLAATHSEEMGHSLDKAILTCKILRKQIAFGTRDPSTNQDMVNFLNQIFTRMKEMLDCRQSMWGRHQILEKCEKMILLFTKVLLDMLELHPLTFTGLIRPTLQFVVMHNFSQAEKGRLFPKFTVNCFNLIKGILMCDVYNPLKEASESNESRMLAYKTKMEFFTYATLTEICRRLVSQYFLLSTEDLLTWETDPEEFCQEEVGDNYKYSLRPCTEVLFLSLFKEFRTSLTPVLLEMVHSVQSPCDPDDFTAVLRKDGVYNAVGLSSYDLFDDVNFDEWFTTHLLRELEIKHQNYRIIRRRVIWLCGQWVGVKFSSSLRPTLYQAMLPLLQKSEDLVVRLETAATLKANILYRFLSPSFSLLFDLLKEVKECDTKMQVLHVISFVIERVGAQIRPYTSSLIHYLPSLWQESEEHNMLRCAILTTLTHLVQGFGTTSIHMYDFLLPVIQASTDVTQDQHVYLMEDGLELWLTMLENCSAANNQILSLYNNMPALLELGTENLRICLKVIERYLLLCPQEFMHYYSRDLTSSLQSLTTDIRTEGLLMILKVIELVFKTFPTEAPELFANYLPKLTQDIIEREEHPTVIAIQMSILGRVILQNKDALWKFLNDFAPKLGKISNELLGIIIDAWVSNIDFVVQPERRKIAALAMASLLSVDASAVPEKFCGIISLCVEVLHDVTSVPVDEDPSIQLDSLVISDSSDSQREEVEEDIEDTEHEKRKRMISKKDPVHTIPLKDFLMGHLNMCQQMYGQERFNTLMSQVDNEIVQQLHAFSH
ncbi:hypothetical protein FSP39_001428 [Pinctada imbricata]|uniref:Importin-11 n=1 Tax=Pinctada imbricata TaxID=66713 RepID=A0AA88YGR9_PINIB|nr:hypothetical protein FSP39_001428 [Pinctada imbricata]